MQYFCECPSFLSCGLGLFASYQRVVFNKRKCPIHAKKNLFKHHATDFIFIFTLTQINTRNQDTAVFKVVGISFIIFLGEVCESDYR